MSRSSLRRHACRAYKAIMRRTVRELEGADLSGLAIVFSPHPDDETLGCGGTIVRKRRAGAAVKIVMMTDGSLSHRRLISEDRLKTLRAGEVLAAARILGVEQQDVIFLEFQDGTLGERRAAAAAKVVDILTRERPDQVFVPYVNDVHSDHLAANRIVRSALRTSGVETILYEYPIWFWHHWPWAPGPIRSRRALLAALKNSILSGVRLLKDFTCAVDIGDVLERKRAALEQYRSQTSRLTSDLYWRTLHDVSNGDFLQCFFQEHEIFRRYRVPARGARA